MVQSNYLIYWTTYIAKVLKETYNATNHIRLGICGDTSNPYLYSPICHNFLQNRRIKFYSVRSAEEIEIKDDLIHLLVVVNPMYCYHEVELVHARW